MANGETLPTIGTYVRASGISAATNYVNIAKFAGKTVKLEFHTSSFLDLFGGLPIGESSLDSIVFLNGPPSSDLNVQKQEPNIIVTWTGDTSIKLLTSSYVSGPWETIPNASSPYS